MKKGKLIATLVLCAALFGACGNQKPEAELHDHDHDHAAHSEHETEPAMEEEAAPENTLVLNEGLRWEANAETTEGVNNMIALMSDFSDSDNLEAYAPLKASLEAEFKMTALAKEYYETRKLRGPDIKPAINVYNKAGPEGQSSAALVRAE